MSSVDEVVYQALSGSATLAALVGSRVYAEPAPQNTQFPLVVYRLISDSPVFGLGGFSGLRRLYVQVDACAAQYEDALVIKDAVFAALAGNFASFKGLAQDCRSLYDEAARVHVVSQDFSVWA